jgi:AraC family transcriptional regulator of adaptative response / DNA-3-methyladenine glycosylase II
MKTGSPESDSIAMLDPEECERACVRRDRRYDGRFFAGCLRVYCRPVCPVRPPQGKKVTFFPTAAAAEAAGFRPCLRCRPETAPYSPAWLGSLTTVRRALRLIRDGALDRGGVDDLATRLGVGARHLDRLFQRHVGASPLQAARTMRVQRAKRLLDRTRLPMSDVAARAGFASLRRFNAVFAEVYGCTPSEIRHQRKGAR